VSSCVAVGDAWEGSTAYVNIAEGWNGKEWTVQPVAGRPGSSSNVSDVSCNGKVWSIESTPDPAGGKMVSLSGVACTSAASCVAVGSYLDGKSVPQTLAVSWSGKTWSIASTPDPKPAGDSLGDVACSASDACTAVGLQWSTSSMRFGGDLRRRG
jgi:hypothetical protein